MDNPKNEQPEVVVRRVVDLSAVSVKPDDKPKTLEAIVREVTVISHGDGKFLVFGKGAFVPMLAGDTVAEDGLTTQAALRRVKALFGKGTQVENWSTIIAAAKMGAKVTLCLRNGRVVIKA